MALGAVDSPDGPPWFGRGDSIARVASTLDRIRQGHGACVCIVGDEGVGKSTLLRQASSDARRLGFHVIEGRSLPGDFPRPFSLVQELVRSASPQNHPSVGAPESGPLSLPLLFAPMLDDRPGLAASPSLSRPKDERQETDELLSALAFPREQSAQDTRLLLDRLVAYLTRLAHHAPTLFAIEGLQFGDDASIRFLAELARSLDRIPAGIAATCLTTARIPLPQRTIVERFLNEPGCERIVVRPFSESETAEFVAWMGDGRAPKPDVLGQWFTLSQGNPVYLEQLARGTIGTSGPGPNAGRPLGYDEVIRERFRELAEEDRRTLTYGAVIGKEFDFATLREASGQDEEALAEALDRMVRLGFLREKPGDVFEFIREGIRSETYGNLTESRRRILHKKVAYAMEARPAGSSARIFELARQFYLAREDAKAIDYNRRAGELAASAFAFDGAIPLYERAIECLDRASPMDLALSVRLHVDLGRALEEAGELRRSISTLTDAVGRTAGRPDLDADRALGLLWLARAHSDLWEHAVARDLAEEARAILERGGNRRALALAHRVLGIAAWCEGRADLAEREHREAGRIAEEDGDTRTLAHSLIDRANTLLYAGSSRNEEALQLYNSAEEQFAKMQDHAAMARVYMNRSILKRNLGRLPDALQDVEVATREARASGSRIWLVYCHLNEAQYRVEMHETDRPSEILEEARALNGQLQDELATQQIAMIQGMIEEERGNLDAAAVAYGEAVALARKMEMISDVNESLYLLARLALRQGDREAATRYYREAIEGRILSLRADLAPRMEQLAEQLGIGPSAPPSP